MTDKNPCQKEFSDREIFRIALKARNFEIKMFWQRCYYFLFLNTSVGIAIATAIAGNVNIKDSALLTDVIPFLCAIGAFVCLAWVKVGLGSMFWQEHWEGIVVDYQRKLGLKGEKDIFSTINTDWRVKKSLEIPYEEERIKAVKKAEERAEKEERGEFVVEPKLLSSKVRDDYYGILYFFSLIIPYWGYKKAIINKPSVSHWMHRTACFFFLAWVVAFFQYDGWEFVCSIWNSISDFLCRIFCRHN